MLANAPAGFGEVVLKVPQVLRGRVSANFPSPVAFLVMDIVLALVERVLLYCLRSSAVSQDIVPVARKRL